MSVRSGARMPWAIGAEHEGSPIFNDAMLVLVGCREVAPGASATAHVVPLCPEYWKLSPGQRIHAQVGSRRYAEAVVVEQVPAIVFLGANLLTVDADGLRLAFRLPTDRLDPSLTLSVSGWYGTPSGTRVATTLTNGPNVWRFDHRGELDVD